MGELEEDIMTNINVDGEVVVPWCKQRRIYDGAFLVLLIVVGIVGVTLINKSTKSEGNRVVYEALKYLYNSTSGDYWKNNENWLNSTVSWCKWYGVTCQADTEYITKLDLRQNKLKGSFPSSISDLSTMRELSLSENQFTGGVPSEIGVLSSLEDLLLNSNGLTGGIPSEIGLLSSLKGLYLQNNKLSGSIPHQISLL